MLPFKKILCPTDFSQSSHEAVKAANELALHFSSDLIVAHVIVPIQAASIISAPGMAYVPPCIENTEAGAQKQLDVIARAMISPDVKTQTVIAHGDAADEIIRLADKLNVDAIVIATHGLTGWRHLVFGSVAEKVVRLAPCAVLTVRISEARMERRKRTA
jgi:nucleotide-binding universal stress UspA family protein